MAKTRSKAAKDIPLTVEGYAKEVDREIMSDLVDKPASEVTTEKENAKMPKGKKGDSTTKSVYVKFTEPEDLACYDRLVADAKSKRYALDTYIMLVLLEAYPEPEQTDLAFDKANA